MEERFLQWGGRFNADEGFSPQNDVTSPGREDGRFQELCASRSRE